MKISTLTCLFAAAVLVGCSSTPLNRAPIVDGVPGRSTESGSQAGYGTYTVKAGDTLYAIALEHGMDWRELARTNGIDDPTKLAIGTKLKVDAGSGPSSDAPANAKSTAKSDAAVVEVTPVTPAGAGKGASAKAVPLGTDVAKGGAQPAAPATKEATAKDADKPVTKEPAKTAQAGDFAWPHGGAIVQSYKAGTNKGIDLAAKVGDPVVASQDGKVVYSGNALRGYGNLIIIKHENKLLTAYAHNKTLLVKEGEVVKRGQKIAEAGQSDTDKPKVHFEVRKNGNPVDPLDYLPAR